MHKALYQKHKVDRLYVSSKEGWRELANIENSVDESTREHEDYIKDAKED